METYIEKQPLIDNPNFLCQWDKTLKELDLPYCFTIQSCFGHFVYGDESDVHNLEPLKTIDSPLDITYIIGTTGHEIEWTPSSATPATFQLYLGGALIDSGSWNGSPITVDVDGLLVGIYNYTLYVYNEVGDFAADSVLVVVSITGTETTDTPPGGDIMVIVISIGSFVVIVVIIGAICRNKGAEGSVSPPSSGYEW